MKILEWIHVVFGLLAIGFGAVVLRGILRVKLSGKWPLHFLKCSLIASVAGLLPPAHLLSPIQTLCMLSVYCSGVVVLAWLRFDLAGIWRSVFAFLLTVVLYLNVVSLSIQAFKHSHLLASAAISPFPRFEITQVLLAAFFAFMGVMVLRVCHIVRTGCQGGLRLARP
jgi:phosphoglycerol transferase MdoB-like AlkP superfamily enzyme